MRLKSPSHPEFIGLGSFHGTWVTPVPVKRNLPFLEDVSCLDSRSSPRDEASAAHATAFSELPV